MKRYRMKCERIGFVPTMGALHEGHRVLLRKARRECDRVVVSIFVNPLQFGPREDYLRYPRTFRRDKTLLEKERIDLLFFPSVKTMVPDLFSTSIDVGPVAEPLCGKFRPGHFRGVATVCTKLFHLVNPDIVYFGQKDFQQTKVIERMLKDLHFDLRMKVVPTVREKDGLALSSRNRALSVSERKKALSLSQALSLGKEMIRDGERRATTVVSRMRIFLRRHGIRRIDYVSVVHPETLLPVSDMQGRVLLAVAAWVGKTRLIDNSLVRS